VSGPPIRRTSCRLFGELVYGQRPEGVDRGLWSDREMERVGSGASQGLRRLSFIQLVGPPLHHTHPLVPKLCPSISSTHRVTSTWASWFRYDARDRLSGSRVRRLGCSLVGPERDGDRVFLRRYTRVVRTRCDRLDRPPKGPPGDRAVARADWSVRLIHDGRQLSPQPRLSGGHASELRRGRLAPARG
jgi:hypothetical protein